MKTIHRANNRRSIFLAALLCLLSLSGLSVYFLNATIMSPPFANTGLSFSATGQWRLATSAENDAADQATAYSGTSAHSLQEIRHQDPLTVRIQKAGLYVTHGLRTFQNVLTFSIDYPYYISKVATHLGNINPIQTASAAASPHITAQLLYASSSQDRINPKLLQQLQHIFKNVTPLSAHSRQNARFSVIYDKSGHIQLATVTVKHKTFQAVRYTDSTGHTGYYTPSGQALFKSLFLAAPLQYTRISDGYTLHRWHPILHITRPHYGIDYAAPTGTPIHAIGSGRVSFAGWGGGYGNAVVITHDTRYKSLYAHMSHINYMIKPGQWVTQGEVIGYVGSTGLATGPHLHFGLYQYGKPVNPAILLPKFKVPTQIARRDLPDFLAKTNRLMTQLAFAQNRNPVTG